MPHFVKLKDIWLEQDLEWGHSICKRVGFAIKTSVDRKMCSLKFNHRLGDSCEVD